MKLFFFSNKFPPDDLVTLFRALRLQAKAPHQVILRQLLSETTTAIREEIRLLPAELRGLLPPFQSILDLAENYNWHRGPLAGTFECVFLCLVPLALFVGNYASHPQDFNFDENNSLFTGLGLGFLAAAAIVASPSLCDVPVTAAELIRISMRAGLVVYQQSQDLEPRPALDSPLQSWTTFVRGLNEETVVAELENFNTSKGVPQPSRIYISVVEPDGSVFINGPPSRMRELFSIPGTLQSASHGPLPVYGGPCHAPHLYDSNHTKWVVQELRSEIAIRDISNGPRLLSMGDGKAIQCQTVLELFQSAADVLLTSTIRWGSVIEEVQKYASGEDNHRDIQLGVFRPSNVTDGLLSAINAAREDCSSSVNDLVQWINEEDSISAGSTDDSIAVVGMSCRLPGGANDLDLFWDLLEEGRDVVERVPANRYDVDTHTDITGKRLNTSVTPFGNFLDSPGLFDAGFFDMSPREAAQTDPTHRLALLTAYEALEQSGYVPDRTRSTRRARVGTFYGQCSDDYREANAGQDIDMYFIPGNYRAFAPGRINYFFKFSGPSYNMDTACSASLAAVQIACTALSRGETDMVVAGGLNILTSSDSFSGLSRAYFLNKTGNCKVFDDSADGYCRGDGIGSVILKRLSDAEQDNDNILGVIRASATNHSAAAVSITHPHAETQADLFRQVLREASVNPLDVDLVEMHGTGTQAGDTIEIESVSQVFCPSPRSTPRSNPLVVSSVKANVGHGEAAAGITALIKALLIFQRNAIPKHVGIKTTLNSKFPDLGPLNIHIPTETVPWPYCPDRKRYVMVNNFSAAGGNTSLLLEEPPVRTDIEALQQLPHTRFVVTVSAKAPISLSGNVERLLAHIEMNPSIHLPSLSYTLTARRMHYNHRVTVHGSSIDDVVKSLMKRLPEIGQMPRKAPPAPKVAFVFSGQGSFYQGVSRQLFKDFPSYHQDIERLDKMCLSHGFPSIIPAINGAQNVEGDFAPIETQLVTVCVQIALTRLWAALGMTPSVVVGASIGEYAALNAAGVLSASDTIYLVGRRAMLMQELCSRDTHAMLAVQASIEEITQHTQGLEATYEVACFNGLRNITLAGSVSSMTEIQSVLESEGYRTRILNVPFAFHSEQVEPILDCFEALTQNIVIRDPKIPVISPTLCEVVSDRQPFTGSYLRDNTRSPVRFIEAIEKAVQLGLVDSRTAFVEIGIHPTYSSAVKAILSPLEVIVPSIRANESNWDTLAASMAVLHDSRIPLNWNEWCRPFESNLRLLTLPSYAWNLKNHWIQHNGDWLLTKDKAAPVIKKMTMRSAFSRTPLIHEIIEESFFDEGGIIVAQSNVMDPDFFDIAAGHRMSGRAVMSVFAYTDMAFSLAKHMYTQIYPGNPLPSMDFGNVRVIQGLIPFEDRSRSQYIRVRMEADLRHSSSMKFTISQVIGELEQELATGLVACDGNPEAWQEEWADYAHLLTSRIDSLQDLTLAGRASQFTKDVVYTLFKNIVDYSKPYHAIQSLVLHGYEAVADLVLTPNKAGRWTAQPHHIDPVAHLGGFILNSGLAPNHDPETVYVMEGWRAMRFAQLLVAGESYRTYVKMSPAKGDAQAGFYTGDLYLLHGDTVVGQIRGMSLRPLPRILMNRFFNPRDAIDEGSNAPVLVGPNPAGPTPAPASARRQPIDPGSTDSSSSSPPSDSSSPSPVYSSPPSTARPASTKGSADELLKPPAQDSVLVRKVLELIASETRIQVSELTDDTTFAELGVDSLLSLVLVEKFAIELNVVIPSKFLLESPTMSELKALLQV
ncbi:hypothetical protein N7456_002573 [Penicillium angulare]|uniref:Uncharacterized protein n=1 Tax=Penicillium angulare TaxID=116970 RepID=A0A9W9G8D0_9EURO|nr:hypothetical protein N7456_002573 [Penicillium angulare]